MYRLRSWLRLLVILTGLGVLLLWGWEVLLVAAILLLPIWTPVFARRKVRSHQVDIKDGSSSVKTTDVTGVLGGVNHRKLVRVVRRWARRESEASGGRKRTGVFIVEQDR